MTGHDYERVVAAYLRNKGYSRVKVTKASGDYGVDVIAHKGKKKYAVQCKYYSSPVSLGAVQEAVAGKAMYGCNVAMVVTNSTFTRSAEELAKKNGVVLIPGVNSTGITLKGVLKFLGICCLLAVAFVLLAATLAIVDTVKSQFAAGQYILAMSNIIEWGFLLIVLIGIPICMRLLQKRWKSKKKDKNTEKGSESIESLNVPEDFKNYLSLKYPTSAKVEDPMRFKKTHEEMVYALSKLRIKDFETYTDLYEIMKTFFAGKRASVSILQRKRNIGFLKADQQITILEDVGFIIPRCENVQIAGLVLVSEQEIIELLAEVERINTPTKKCF